MDKHEKTAKIFKAFCDEQRLAILELLQDGEKCACELLEKLDITQSTLSHHMKILCDSGIVAGRKDGKWMHYSISESGTEHVKKLIKEITMVSPNKTNSCC
ncbi:ArsR/SmtB family transcription factor [Lacrimispora celerecrescens]|uniref:ArsR family transcriptional regulator n=1 Tax=[Clostridium] celerecrescens 18A TaxID=1286362 RepID=A0A2M8Z3X1_9FIRM|nr:metalloregulator ArsR/SmtB family transcription factor [Lacrimispora celerecrescens]PJJ28139.1 ArsR family transcriptional regulator [[Clostridium] celerecrescens 18A]